MDHATASTRPADHDLRACTRIDQQHSLKVEGSLNWAEHHQLNTSYMKLTRRSLSLLERSLSI